MNCESVFENGKECFFYTDKNCVLLFQTYYAICSNDILEVTCVHYLCKFAQMIFNLENSLK